MRRTLSVCCACAASGQGAAAQPNRVINSRRLMGSLGLRPKCYHINGSKICVVRGSKIDQRMGSSGSN